jgi:hypothetical protein
MKKFLVVSLMLILLGGFVVAQEVGVSASVKGKFTLIDYNQYLEKLNGETKEADVLNYDTTIAGTKFPDANITFKAQDDAAGLTVSLDLDELYNTQQGLFKNGQNSKYPTDDDDTELSVWFKPLKNDLITLIAGYNAGDATLQYDNLESGDTIEATGRVRVKDYISGFSTFVVTSKPIDALFIGLGYKTALTSNTDITKQATYPGTRGPGIVDYLTGIHIGAGYEIAGIGAVRAQYVGPYPSLKKKEPKDQSGLLIVYPQTAGKEEFNSLEFGFKVTALENIGLLIDVVGKVPLAYKDETTYSGANATTYNKPVAAGVVANFATGALSVKGGVGVELPYTPEEVAGNNTPTKKGLAFKAHVEPTYKIGDALTVGADLGLATTAKTTDPTSADNGVTTIGLGAFVQYAVGAGTLQTGLAATITSYEKGANGTNEALSHLAFQLPITINVAF